MQNQSQEILSQPDPSHNLMANQILNSDKNAKTTQNLLVAGIEQRARTEPILEAGVKLQIQNIKKLEELVNTFKDIEIIRGKQGEIGPVGPKGDSIVGPQGPVGPRGERGIPGESIRGLRGFRGEKGEPGIDGTDGKNGKNGKDGKIVKLKAKDIIDLISGKIKYGDIKDAPEFRPKGWLGSGYTADLSDWGQFLVGLKAGNYTPAGTAGGVETPVGDMNGVNITYTVLNTPKFITLNGQVWYENFGYTLAGLTITTDIAPLVSDVLRSHY